MAELEKYFDGQKSWLDFLSNFNEEWKSSEFQKSLLNKLNNQIDIAKVIYFHIGENSLEWINKKIPALDNLTPLECLKTEKTTNRLKECLMRMK
ncbi:uncharacterized protein DUF2384 [Aquimarina sp. MAR_2010_214]|uniref:antitoxin Xre/MbcA/ParS toxin-binding domain-containing protein n=1 Tax=Aquimarina sp. MAR_2010_214 TaxID=1250026 RepID=UPI000C70A387|nr:antitoxin Xre/MbcA/ParS toxin-binding domain-containing protein [Aquimarina sp. MAR_2010_214]PKV51538.1 uncharacterized protein DUF2384 [Aquimarina sp. MAR_2010_214]